MTYLDTRYQSCKPADTCTDVMQRHPEFNSTKQFLSPFCIEKGSQFVAIFNWSMIFQTNERLKDTDFKIRVLQRLIG